MNKNNKNCSLAYIRSIEKIDRVLTLVQASNFIDMTSAKTVDTVCIVIGLYSETYVHKLT